MPEAPLQRLRPPARVLATTAVVSALVLAGIAAALVFGSPPRTVTLATGKPGSAYAVLGERYKAILARSGVTVKLVATAGDAENLEKLRDRRSGVDAAFVISGLPDARQAT